jgi:hypothetical protein
MRDGEYRDVHTLAALAHGLRPHLSALSPTTSQLASTRRALCGLAERGFVFRVGRKWTRDKRRVLADRVRQNHYTGSVPSGKSFYFAFEDAIVVYAIPANRNLSHWLLGRPNAVLELARLVAPDGHRPNLLTEAISASVRWLREREPTCEAIISYADSAAGHHGGVYRAASWVPLAASPGKQSFRCMRTGRPVGRRSFHSNGKGQLREAEIVALGYEKTNGTKHRYARGLTRSARRAIAEKARELAA